MIDQIANEEMFSDDCLIFGIWHLIENIEAELQDHMTIISPLLCSQVKQTMDASNDFIPTNNAICSKLRCLRDTNILLIPQYLSAHWPLTTLFKTHQSDEAVEYVMIPIDSLEAAQPNYSQAMHVVKAILGAIHSEQATLQQSAQRQSLQQSQSSVSLQQSYSSRETITQSVTAVVEPQSVSFNVGPKRISCKLKLVGKNRQGRYIVSIF